MEQLLADAAARSCDLPLAVGSTLSVYPIGEVLPAAVAGIPPLA